ncbi:MAG: hypothetical protein ACJLS3_09970 [Erythrobacter sp.]
MNPREFLPGTVRASDRFVRASFYIDAVEQTARSTPRRRLGVQRDTAGISAMGLFDCRSAQSFHHALAGLSPIRKTGATM